MNNTQASSPITVTCYLPLNDNPVLDMNVVRVNSLISGHSRELEKVSISRAVHLQELFPP